MSGDSNGGFTFCPYGRLTEQDEALVSMMFDEDTDWEEMELKHIMKETHIMKRICLMRTILFPLEVLLNLALLGRMYAADRIAQQSLYWKFWRGKLTISEFQRAQLDLAMDVAKKMESA